MHDLVIHWAVPIVVVAALALLLGIGLAIHRVIARKRWGSEARRAMLDELAELGLEPPRQRVMLRLLEYLDLHVDPRDLLDHRPTFERAVHPLMDQLLRSNPQHVAAACRHLGRIRAVLGFDTTDDAAFVSTRQIARGTPVRVVRKGSKTWVSGIVGRIREDLLDVIELDGASRLRGEVIEVSLLRDNRRYVFDTAVVDAADTSVELRHSLVLVDVDLRQDMRVPVTRPEFYRRHSDERWQDATLVDISVGGVAMRCPRVLAVGDTVELDMDALGSGTVDPDAEPWRIRARIVGANREAGEHLYNLQFHEDDVDRSRLFALVNALDRERRDGVDA